MTLRLPHSCILFYMHSPAFPLSPVSFRLDISYTAGMILAQTKILIATMAYYFLYIQCLCRDVHIIKISMRLVFVDQNSELHVYKYEKKDTSLVRNVTQLLKNARIISRFFTRLIGHVAGFTRSSTTKQGLRWIGLTHSANLPLNPLARLCCVWVFFLVPVVLTTLYKFFTSAGKLKLRKCAYPITMQKSCQSNKYSLTPILPKNMS